MTSKLTPAQYAFLVAQIQDNRVRQLRGNSHLEAWDIRRHLIRAFGFGGFDIETKSLDLVAQIEHPPTQQGGKPRWTVVYRAEVRLIVKASDGTVLAVYEDGASGDSQNQPSLGDAHDQAMKTALSQGLKRCAVNLGDQFGLSLYNGGRVNSVVIRSLVHPEAPAGNAAPTLPQDDAPVLPEPGTEQADEQPAAAEEPAAPAPADPPRMVEQAQHRAMHALWRELGYDGEANREKRLEVTAKILGLAELNSSADLTREQAQTVINALRSRRDQIARLGGGAAA